MTLLYLNVYFWYYCYEVSMQNQLDVEKGNIWWLKAKRVFYYTLHCFKITVLTHRLYWDSQLYFYIERLNVKRLCFHSSPHHLLGCAKSKLEYSRNLNRDHQRAVTNSVVPKVTKNLSTTIYCRPTPNNNGVETFLKTLPQSQKL